MLKFLTTLLSDLAGRAGVSRSFADCAAACADWLRDPLAHPELETMNLSQIADLPAGQLRSLVRE
ncbi:hypothetical protein [Mesorhizobium australicum]|uniref:Uncharacterized protein n=1 Tax=Mesorhizobium australicum TaxID=536018 RepID=A0A1X7PIQ1_9HYPH|nr:hypothetical protein [Mesorhizobium australicum]SMH51238.1 hypothetical protein SAMN02982922_4358 [Mesorhizobium australicum]